MTVHAWPTKRITFLLVLAALTFGSFPQTYGKSRQRRSCSEPHTMTRFIELVGKIEDGWFFRRTSSERVSAYLRLLAYDDWRWTITCGTTITGTVWRTGLDEKEIKELKALVKHSSNSTTGLETSALLTNHGNIAISHAITGISCGGFNRDTHVTTAAIVGFTSNIDSLFQSTIAGDIGQTTLLHYAYPKKYPLLGPSGDWDSISCPNVYHLKGMSSSELTDAEMLGNMDGVILGTLIPMIKQKPLSEILHDYYQGNGVDAGGRKFKASARIATFGKLIPDYELKAQSLAFTKAFYNLKITIKWWKSDSFWESVDISNGISKEFIFKKVPATVQQFYEKFYTQCPDVLTKKYRIKYFVDLVKQLERETNFGIADMTRAIVTASKYPLPDSVRKVLHKKKVDYTYTSGFSWYVIREMLLHRFADRDGRRELGVIDAGGDTVAVGPVLAGLAVGANYKTEPSGSMTEVGLAALHKVTVTGILASAADSRSWTFRTPKQIMGLTGVWVTSSCPPKYRLKTKIKTDQQTTRAELFGGIDCLVLGEPVSRWLAADPRLKLSDVLERYYGAGYQSVSSQHRLDQFKTVNTDNDAYIQRVKHACSSWYCKRTADETVEKLYSTMLPSHGDDKSSTGSQFLPDYRTLMAVYPGDKAEGGDISGVDLRKKVTGNLQLEKTKTLAAIDGLRLSYLLNQLDGHHIPKDNSQGAFIGRDKKVYIYDLAALKTYLTKTYGDPLTASSVSEVTGQSGILMLDVSQTDRSAGSVGLWDGKNMHQIKDYAKASSVRSVTLWKTNELGDCMFYACLDSKAHGKDDYALAYGYRYCQRFSNLYDDFNSYGKKWVDDNKICLMKDVARLYKGIYSRGAIKRIAFNSHADCYVKSGSFCKMASDSVNSDALFNVFKPQKNEFWKNEDRAAWEQVLDTMRYCNKKLSATTIKNLKEFNKRGHDKMRHSILSRHQDEGSKTPRVETASHTRTVSPSKCIDYANSGDCRFYKCFQQRFPCNVFGVSHVTDFEFPVCQDLERQNELFELQVTYL
ncbi:hypothetical protein LSAT2_022199 [Lamellibrachia satsuma]|nr:hypothetical protein LSAT2_022199 [Lamellibrachia satsuma]